MKEVGVQAFASMPSHPASDTSSQLIGHREAHASRSCGRSRRFAVHAGHPGESRLGLAPVAGRAAVSLAFDRRSGRGQVFVGIPTPSPARPAARHALRRIPHRSQVIRLPRGRHRDISVYSPPGPAVNNVRPVSARRHRFPSAAHMVTR
jgi:hypothetical protein